MIVPVKSYSRISTHFGATPDTGVFHKHAGTDYACPVGTVVVAAISGKVTQSFDGTTAGGQVEITDATYSVRTLHMSRRDVKVGQQVTTGQQIGLSGNTGTGSTGPHCHIDVRKAGTAWDHSFSDYFDPEKLIGEEMITKEQELVLSQIATGSSYGKDYSSKFQGTSNWDGILNFWLGQSSKVDAELEETLAKTATGSAYGKDYNSPYQGKLLADPVNVKKMATFWLGQRTTGDVKAQSKLDQIKQIVS